MARGKLSQEEIVQLNNNPYVIYAEEKRIVYSNDFKFLFINQLQAGKRPSQIFADAGFDTNVLGSKRIERAAARWKESYAAGSLGNYDDSHLRKIHAENESKRKKQQINKTIRSQSSKIKRLESKIASQQVSFELKISTHEQDLATLKSKNKSKLQRQKERHSLEISDLKQQKDDLLQYQKACHSEKMDTLKSKHERKLEKQKEILEKTVAENNEKLRKQAETIEKLRAEVDALKKAGSLGRRRCEGKAFGNHSIFEVIKSTIEKFSLKNCVKLLCDALGVARSSFYHYINSESIRKNIIDKDEKLFAAIKAAFDSIPYKNKGARSIRMVLLRNFDLILNRKCIQRIMRKFNLVCPIRTSNPYKGIWKASKEDKIAPNLLERNFKTGVPLKVLLTDITYLKHQGRFSYLSLIMDAETNEPLSYVLSQSLKVDFVIDSLKKIEHLQFAENVLIHSDQGVHYTCKAVRDKLKKMNIRQSMSRKGNCLDNASCESFFGHMKQELPDIRNFSFDELSSEIDKYMQYYRYERYQENLCWLTPYEYHSLLVA